MALTILGGRDGNLSAASSFGSPSSRGMGRKVDFSK
jgi:hypothetical protein